MKRSRAFIGGVLIFLLLIFAVEYQLPKQFVWTPSFSSADEQPFGCALFDRWLAQSWPQGYTVSDQSLPQLAQEDSTKQRGILVVSEKLVFSKTDIEALFSLARRGNRLMLVGMDYGRLLSDTLNFSSGDSFYNQLKFKKYTSSAAGRRDTILWADTLGTYPKRIYQAYAHLLAPSLILEDSTDVQVLSQWQCWSNRMPCAVTIESMPSVQNTYPVLAFTRRIGRGQVTVASSALLFTNYGILDRDQATYLLRLLSGMKGVPLVRTTGYSKRAAEVSQSPFRYMLSKPPLRWALYLTFMGIVLLMLFTAKRRQRVIPVVVSPPNKSVEFVELIGTLFFRKRDHAALVKKRYSYLAEQLRREIRVDVDEVQQDGETFLRIAQKTGLPYEEVAGLFREVRPVLYGSKTLSDVEMKRLIDQMNNLVNHL